MKESRKKDLIRFLVLWFLKGRLAKVGALVWIVTAGASRLSLFIWLGFRPLQASQVHKKKTWLKAAKFLLVTVICWWNSVIWENCPLCGAAAPCSVACTVANQSAFGLEKPLVGKVEGKCFLIGQLMAWLAPKSWWLADNSLGKFLLFNVGTGFCC